MLVSVVRIAQSRSAVKITASPDYRDSVLYSASASIKRLRAYTNLTNVFTFQVVWCICGTTTTTCRRVQLKKMCLYVCVVAFLWSCIADISWTAFKKAPPLVSETYTLTYTFEKATFTSERKQKGKSPMERPMTCDNAPNASISCAVTRNHSTVIYSFCCTTMTSTTATTGIERLMAIWNSSELCCFTSSDLVYLLWICTYSGQMYQT